MPIDAPDLPRLGRREFAAFDYEVMRHAFAMHNEIGRMCDEQGYQADLTTRLSALDWPDCRREVPIRVSHQSFVKEYFIDLLVADRFVYELKTVETLTSSHKAQLLNYLLLTNTAHGKLINFRPLSVKAEFVNAAVDNESRHEIQLVRDDFDHSAAGLREILMNLLADWGLFLDTALYSQALVHFLGGEAQVCRQLPLSRSGTEFASQRFQLVERDAAFLLTSYGRHLETHHTHFQRLINHSPLRALHWINLWQHEVSLCTIEKVTER
jgi:GxxExxY protein